MDARDAISTVIVVFFGNLLTVKADTTWTHFQRVAGYNDTYCSAESDVTVPVNSNFLCAHKCSLTDGCKGYFYNYITRACSTVTNVSETLDQCQTQVASGFYYQACGVRGGWITRLSDIRITASSGNAREKLGIRWVAGSFTVQEYLQFDFWKTMVINQITTGSSYFVDYEVKQFKIQFSADCTNFTEYRKVFNGYINNARFVLNVFNPVIVARCVRVNPQTRYSATKLRVHLLACEA